MNEIRRIPASEMDWSRGARSLWTEPLLIEGGAAHWPIAQRLTLDGLVRDFGRLATIVKRTRTPNDRWSATLAEFVAYARVAAEDDPYYLPSVRISELDRDLYDALPLPVAFENWLERMPSELQPEMYWVFVGPAGSGTAMHQDILGSSAWNAVFEGEKEWTFQRLSGDAEAFVGIQRAGDVMYTPPTWFHGVVNTRPCVALTGNYINASNVDAAIDWLAAQGRNDWVRLLGYLKHDAEC